MSSHFESDSELQATFTIVPKHELQQKILNIVIKLHSSLKGMINKR